jgi:hypothetical protein
MIIEPMRGETFGKFVDEEQKYLTPGPSPRGEGKS